MDHLKFRVIVRTWTCENMFLSGACSQVILTGVKRFAF